LQKIEEIVSFFKENPVCALATVNEEKPSVRPIQLMFEDEKKFYFCTANTKNMYKQMKTNPNVELTTSSKDYGTTLRICGKVKFNKNITLKQKIINTNSLVKSIYQTAENPIFEVFSIDHGTASLQYLNGDPTKTIVF